MKSSSKFDALFAQRRDYRDVDQELSSAPEQKRLGRPPGKRSHPDYAQVTAYIPAALHNEVKIALIREGKKEFSRLVEELLRAWIHERTTGRRGTQQPAVQS
jgi:hypothetical protein